LRRAILAPAAALLALAAAGPAGSSVAGDAALARTGLARAVAAGRVTSAEADADRARLAHALSVLRRLGGAREANLRAVLGEVAAHWRSYTTPRALTLFSMLDANARYLGTHVVPAARTDITDGDGVVYRLFPGRGFQFHPLGNAIALLRTAASQDPVQTDELAQALVARGVLVGASSRWEYYFAYGGGSPPWTSGMAQAVMAQALTRAASLTEDQTLLAAARAAYRAIPGRLVQQLREGPWIRLYSFDREVVLNAQLQAIVSLQDYAKATGDGGAGALADRMLGTAETLLPRFDTGYWSLYELGGQEAPLEYERYVAELTKKLARTTGDPFWDDAAIRFAGYLEESPELRPGPTTPTIYPEPADGYLDSAPIPFWLSKRSTVSLRIAGRTTRLMLSHGQHVLTWAPGPALRPGPYSGRLTAVDLAGNTTVLDLPPVQVAWDVRPPQIDAVVDGTTLSWTAIDPGTPWLRIQVVLARLGSRKVLDLGRKPLSGFVELRLPAGSWNGTLVAENSARKRSQVPLGPLPFPG
jgi:D-glucuronyl C5-epimerase C-terminus